MGAISIGSLLTYVKSVFGANTGASFARWITFVIVAFVLGWDTSYVFMAWQLNRMGGHWPMLPDTATLIGQTGFMTAFYALNKGVNVLTRSDNSSTVLDKASH